MRIRKYALAPLAALACGGGAQAQNYPTKTVHIVVPLAAGGAADTITRAIAQRLTEVWNQQVVVENKPLRADHGFSGAVRRLHESRRTQMDEGHQGRQCDG